MYEEFWEGEGGGGTGADILILFICPELGTDDKCCREVVSLLRDCAPDTVDFVETDKEPEGTPLDGVIAHGTGITCPGTSDVEDDKEDVDDDDDGNGWDGGPGPEDIVTESGIPPMPGTTDPETDELGGGTGIGGAILTPVKDDPTIFGKCDPGCDVF